MTLPPLLALIADQSRSTLIKQGAEAKVYRSTLWAEQPQLTLPPGAEAPSRLLPTSPDDVLLKHRFTKTYRHHTLSTSLTHQRTSAEARALLRCARAEPRVEVPTLRCVDGVNGVLGMEWVEGKSVRQWLGGGKEEEINDEAGQDEEEQEDEVLSEDNQHDLMTLIGVQLARMHAIDVVHGDLTTSNMMLRDDSYPPARRLVLIDFGLSYISPLPEDKAVDLYVLERAFASTHPGSRGLFSRVLDAYAAEAQRVWRQRQTSAAAEAEKAERASAPTPPPVKGSDSKKKSGKQGGERKNLFDLQLTIPRLDPWEETKRKLDDGEQEAIMSVVITVADSRDYSSYLLVRLRGRKRSMVG